MVGAVTAAPSACLGCPFPVARRTRPERDFELICGSKFCYRAALVALKVERACRLPPTARSKFLNGMRPPQIASGRIPIFGYGTMISRGDLRIARSVRGRAIL
jgi:hypothetical protein